jgi:hypothetical protein
VLVICTLPDWKPTVNRNVANPATYFLTIKNPGDKPGRIDSIMELIQRFMMVRLCELCASGFTPALMLLNFRSSVSIASLSPSQLAGEAGLAAKHALY